MASYKFPNSGDTSAHSFAPEQAAEVAAQMVGEDAFLAALVSRNYENDLMGAPNRTINVRVPQGLVARERAIADKTTGITVDELSDATYPITLGTHAYSAVTLSEDDLNFKIRDFASRVLAPQTEAVADKVENTVAAALEAETVVDVDTLGGYDPANPTRLFTRIRKALRDRGVPIANLNVVVGTEVYAQLMDAKALEDASQSGSTEALREGNVGRVRGMNVVESTRVDEEDVFAFHRDAFVLAVRAPAVPQGAPFGSTVNSGGFPLRWVRDYDVRVMSDLSVVSTFLGVAKMPLYKLERDYATFKATVSTVPGGAVLRTNIGTAGA